MFDTLYLISYICIVIVLIFNKLSFFTPASCEIEVFSDSCVCTMIVNYMMNACGTYNIRCTY